MMVQQHQPFDGLMGPQQQQQQQQQQQSQPQSQQTQQQQQVVSTTLAMPAIVATSNEQQQFSPNETSFYQQQLIKNVQQQYMQQQHLRLNGLQQASPTSINLNNTHLSQYSANSQQNSPSTNGHHQHQHPQQPEPLYNGLGRPTPMYTSRPHQSYMVSAQQQQQPQPQQQAMYQTRSVPQVAPQAAYYPGQPLRTVAGQAQPQQLMLAYPSAILGAADLNRPNYGQPLVSGLTNTLQAQQQQQQSSWPSEPHHNAIQQQHPILTTRSSQHRARSSDRDSISTASRLNNNPHDLDRRSFTLRSQFTNVHQHQAKGKRSFGFLKLTGAALRKLTGLGQPSSSGLTATAQIRPLHSKGGGPALVTAIDSGEELLFRRKVFQYELVLWRMLSLIGAAFVLLSPLAMLLLPKLEFAFRTISGNSASVPDSSGIEGPGVTHGLGLGSLASRSLQPVNTPQWRIADCGPECDGPLLGFVARLLLLALAHWAIFGRARTATLPRVELTRCLLSALAILLTLAYWLFFMFRLFDKRYNDFELQYLTVVQFSLSMLESLLFLHYAAVLWLELRPRRKSFCLKVVRSPDGEARYYTCGELSIQRCAQLVLDKYHRQFPSCGPHAQQLMQLEDQQLRHSSNDNSPLDNNHAHSRGLDRSSSPTHSTRNGQASDRRRSASRNSRRARSPSPPDSPTPPSNRRKQPVSASLDPVAPVGSLGPASVLVDEIRQTGEQPESLSADQGGGSSDATTGRRNKDQADKSSLETIRAAHSSSDLQIREQQQSRTRQQRADDLESMRSGRSRRSTSRRKHHAHHRERSSSGRNASGFNGTEPVGKHAHHSQDPNNINEHQQASDTLDELERRVRRRRLRLLQAVQDSFEQIGRAAEQDVDTEQLIGTGDANQFQQQTAKQPLGASQAARSLYPRIARSLQKYLRLTKQNGRHNLQSIHEHLSKCLLYRLSARTFIEKFTNQDPVWQQTETNLFANCRISDPTLTVVTPQDKRNKLEINSWSLICDTLLSRQINSGTYFVLKQGDVSLLVTVATLPHLNLTEEVIDQKLCKFLLKSSSSAPDTSVV